MLKSTELHCFEIQCLEIQCLVDIGIFNHGWIKKHALLSENRTEIQKVGYNGGPKIMRNSKTTFMQICITC